MLMAELTNREDSLFSMIKDLQAEIQNLHVCISAQTETIATYSIQCAQHECTIKQLREHIEKLQDLLHPANSHHLTGE